jgi:hypothetical protein
MDRQAFALPVRHCFISDQLIGQENGVRTINFAEAKARLSILLPDFKHANVMRPLGLGGKTATCRLALNCKNATQMFSDR